MRQIKMPLFLPTPRGDIPVAVKESPKIKDFLRAKIEIEPTRLNFFGGYR
jgi:hypothetical protein